MASTPTNPQPTPNANTQIRVQAQRRLDGAASVVFTPDLIYIVDTYTGNPNEIVMTGPTGIISPTLLPPSLNILLQTNSVDNIDQSLLNLKQGTNIVITADAFGGVTISASGSFSTSFGQITTGDNTTAAMTVDTGATLSYTNSGILNANEIGTINVTGNLPTHAGEILVSQPGNTTAVWADPQVQGLYAAGSSLAAPPAYTPPSTIQPILVGGEGPNGTLTNIQTTAAGTIIVVPADEQEAALILTFSANNGTTPLGVTTRVPVLSIQPQTGSTALSFLLRKLRVVGNGQKALFELVLNGTLTGATFTSVDPSSGVNFDTVATSISGGRVVDSGYINFAAQDPDYLLHFGFTGGTADIFTLVVTSMTAFSNPISASFRWTEEAQSL